MLAILRLVTALAGNSAQRAGLRVARLSVLLLFALVFLGIGLMGFGVAAFILLARLTDPLIAALLLGSTSCLIGGVLLLVARAQARPKRLFLATPEEQLAQRDLSAMLSTASKTGIWVPLVLAVLGGFFVTNRK